MIRFSLMAIGFAGVTAVLIVALGQAPDSEQTEQVSRARPDALTLQPDTSLEALSLQPALELLAAAPQPDVRPATSQIIVPQGSAVAESLRPKARPRSIALLASRSAVPVVPPVVRETDDAVDDILRVMSRGIVQEMQKPVAPTPVPTPTSRVVTAPVVTPPAVAKPITSAATADRVYTVRQGDSLPGIAFRFYGSTVAYLEILEANRNVLNSPSDVRAGMTLRIPDLN